MDDGLSAEFVKRVARAGFAQNASVLEEFIAPEMTMYNRHSELDGDEVLDRFRQGTPMELVDCKFIDVLTGESEAAVFAETEYEVSGEIMGIEPREETYVTRVAVYYTFDETDEVTSIQVIENREDFLSKLGFLTDSVKGGDLTKDLKADKIRLEYREVLMRVLRHNIRNKIGVIQIVGGQLLDDRSTVNAGEKITAAADELARVADKAREVEKHVLAPELAIKPVVLADVAHEVLSATDADCEWTIQRSDGATVSVRTDRSLLYSALEELVENAIQHTDRALPSVTITIEPASTDGYDATLVVEDDGPGIPNHELAPLREETETDLLHASNVGLWRVKWSIERLDGDISFEAPENAGTRVRIRLPALGDSTE